MKELDKEKKVDIIIPTYCPDEKFLRLLLALKQQSMNPHKVIIVNTDRETWNRLQMNKKISEIGEFSFVFHVHHIKKEEFDHGESRNLGVRLSGAPYFVCMTQDAVPADENLIKNLLEGMSDRVKCSYARQLPREGASPLEKYTREFNYPKVSLKKSQEDKERLGIKTYFSSNVCAIYERESFDALGGFVEKTILNEDMLYAVSLLQTGGYLYYNAEAKVYHSHEYSGIQQFKRNFDIGVSQAEYADVFAGLKSEGEGIRLVKNTAKYLISEQKAYWIPKLIYISACKYMGFLLGKKYKILPMSLRRRFSMNREYWQEE